MVEVACLAEELGFDGMAMPDHLFVPVRGVIRYPYSGDGHPPFGTDTLWNDAFVVAGAAAARTKRIRFSTGIYILPLRHPLIVARALASVEAIAPGRVSLGIGVGWMLEEFETLGVNYRLRGALTDESIEVLRKLWRGGLVEHAGPHYPIEATYFEPHPSQPIPILVGGMSDAALSRAARIGDGFISMPTTTDNLLEIIERINKLRVSFDRAEDPFMFHTFHHDALDVGECRRLVEAGVDAFYISAQGNDATEIRGHLERILDEIVEPLRASGHAAPAAA
jgi:probable F420-dependent oxidoreductase